MNADEENLPTSDALRAEMDAIYRGRRESDIPWTQDKPPAQLNALVEEHWISPCKALDLGCGIGNYTLWFARLGFTMTGVDLSAEAVRIARLQAKGSGVACRFLSADLCSSIDELSDEEFDFAYDWQVLHHVDPAQRQDYLRNVRRLLHPGAAYYSASFSEHDASFGGKGKIRRTPLGTRLYFSSEEELRALYAPIFLIEDMRVEEVEGKAGVHHLVAARLRVPGQEG